ncbi:MAG: hypothetical protein CL386_04520 [Acidiferrobacter sp.]|nr:hypothetical protein [Acidiferrobacter sp.]
MKNRPNDQDCVFCAESTAIGSGRFVNRIPADTYNEETGEYLDGYACAGCMSRECEVCGSEVAMDEDLWVRRKDGSSKFALNIGQCCWDPEVYVEGD